MNDKPIPESGAEQGPQNEATTGSSGTGERHSASLVSGILLAVLLVTSVLQGVYSHRLSSRLAEIQSQLQASVSAQGESIQQLAHRLGETEQRHDALKEEVSSTQQRVGATQGQLRRTQQIANQVAQQQKQAAEQLTSQLSQLQQEQVTTQGTVGTLSSDLTGVKQEVSLTKDQLATTRSELQRVIGDLGVQSDLIAHNREELAELRLRGEREYFEFNLRKTKQPQRVGDVALLLKKTDVKRQKYTLNLLADDRTIEKKDKTTNEPVQFYQEGYRQTTEIVVNQIYKDRIVGYVSVPKKKEAHASATLRGPENTPGSFGSR